MSKRAHDILRLLQRIIPHAVAIYSLIDYFFGIGLVGLVEGIVAEVIALIGEFADGDSARYFDTKSIVTKILPDRDKED